MATCDKATPHVGHETDKASKTHSSFVNSSSASASEKAGHVIYNVTPVVVETLAHVTEVEELFKTLSSVTNCHSLLHKHLAPAIFDTVKGRKTSFGGTLADCIRSGCLNLDSRVGIYACDPDAYKVFSEVLNPVIKEYHQLPQKKNIHHPHTDFGDPVKCKLEDLDPDGKFIISSRVRVDRSLDGFGFSPVLTCETRQELERKAVEALNDLVGELKGTYYPMTGMTIETQARLTQDHILFNDSDSFLKAAGGYDDWPTGRGIFVNENKTFLVWINEENHLRLISLQKGGDIGASYKRLIAAVKTVEEKLKFARDDNLGFLTFCPSNLGTALRASVHIKIPQLAASDKFPSICDKLNLQARGINREYTETEGDVYDISNKRRLGITELQAVKELYNGVKEIIKLEKDLSWWPENVHDIYEHISEAKNCKSLVKKHLSKDILDKLKDKKTAHGASLEDCIISGAVNLDSEVGLYAADPESYTDFALLFDPVIKDYHKVKATDDITHPTSDFGDLENLGFSDLDPEGEMIISTRIRVRRSHKDFPFPPILKNEDRAQMQQMTVDALNSLSGDLKGSYHPLEGLSRQTQEKLANDHFLFNDNERFLKAASGYKDWPTGRGVFLNESKSLCVWVNVEDHLRIISVQNGGDIGAVYTSLVNAIKFLEERLAFARDERLGYLTFCPTNLGTALKASVLIKIPHLAACKSFKATCEKLRLQARGIHSEHTDSEDGICDLSNKRRLGLTEIEAVSEMVAAIQEVMRLEKEAAADKTKSCALL